MELPGRRSNSGAILIAFIVGLLACAVVVSEVPELLTLTDSTSNDFTVRKPSTPARATSPSVVNRVSILPITKYQEYGRQVGWTSIFEGVKPASANLFILLRTLRT